VHFALIGRIQIKYSQGIWNEWHLLFDDMRTGWLSEAGGEYVLTFMRQVDERCRTFRRCASVSACRWPARVDGQQS
jgi:hypothetical protein